jgi:predicted Zn-dependent peptidase
VAAAGNLKHEDLLGPVRRALGKVKPPRRRTSIRPPRPHPNLTLKTKQLEQVHLLLGTQALSAVDPKRYVLSILNTIFGGGMSSRLFQEVREKRGLAYSVYSFLSSFMDSGMLGVYVGTGEDQVSQVLQIILKEMKKLEGDSLSRRELQSAKEQLKGNLLLSLESTDTRMGRLAKNQIYFNRYIGTEEIIEDIGRVTADEVCGLAHEIFHPDALSLTVLGPATEKKIPKPLRQRRQ